ncbi:hypothetical protein AB0F72_26275 [Actinoplanes sp. NPDC023936]|uniref:hypothetical protein n=1 Tax=Actinoplanes sp. NPDC023936 TaxID=3154910 RepID=UPI0033EDC957
MSETARALLTDIQTGIAAGAGPNPLVAAVTTGRAPLAAVAALAAEERIIVPADQRAFLLLAARSEEPAAVRFFTGLAQGEGLVQPMIPPLAAAAGMGGEALASYEPRAGCQAYPSIVAWLALNAEPAAVALALVSNFAAWGGYCAELARGLRERYGFGDDACAFLDFFAEPVTEPLELAVVAAQAAIDSGRDLGQARRHARLLHENEELFWRTLAEIPG